MPLPRWGLVGTFVSVAGGRWRRLRTLIRGGGCVTLVSLLILVLAAPAEARFDDPDLDSSAAYTYDVRPDEGLIEVTIELAVTADKPNQTIDAFSYNYFYFDGYALFIPEGATDIGVVDGAGRTLQTTETVEQEAILLEIDFARNLFYRQTTNLTISFTLTGALPRSDEPARVNPSYAGFPIWLSGNIEQASIEVVTPTNFHDFSAGDLPLHSTLVDGQLHWRNDDVDPELVYTFASFTNDDELGEAEVQLDDIDITLRYWPDDREWADGMEAALTSGLGILIDRIGQPWPVSGTMVVKESYGPSVHGYAGWFDTTTNVIEVGDELDEQVIFHELTHAWFHGDLFAERWIYEGLSELYAAEVIEGMGQPRPEPESISPPRLEADALNTWTEFTRDREREEWAYPASWTVMEAIVDEIGIEAMAAVVEAAVDKEPAYLGDDEATAGDGADDGAGAGDELDVGVEEVEAVPRVGDWRRFLDLVENRGEVTDGAIVDLFNEWVLDSIQADRVEDRAEARSHYHDLLAAGDTWAGPVGVRRDLAEWRFEDATEQMAAAEAVLDTRDALIETVDPVGVELPALLEERYEASDEGFVAVEAALAQATTAGRSLRTARDRVAADPSVIEQIGLIGWDQSDELDRSATAFERGQLAVATVEAREVTAVIDGAERRGWIVVGIAGGLLLLLVIGFFLTRLRRHRRRAVPTEADAEAETTAEHPVVAGPNPEAGAEVEVEADAMAAGEGEPTAEVEVEVEIEGDAAVGPEAESGPESTEPTSTM